MSLQLINVDENILLAKGETEQLKPTRKLNFEKIERNKRNFCRYYQLKCKTKISLT